ncbi:hypothetical protein CEUSTIGMA_g2625.t1 [Chlamydomonas eustigma]|uniref:SANT and BTB domain-containing protein n=1 Tax=Chlamydomonas eustigma TaxID=1157962 RepID=A0A250WWJ0_9CHLO|nr:hypothetical protein CEUSTIGMA_g2625.t1 [Chlamydomonas eustigma]|eukprot:GAX75181.1 hypothetical protein CEUSTIGMA_g2625.t1 [Chlamydomonas eustigma]
MSVLITVCDEANGTSKKFLSDGALLLSSMRYFQEHIKHVPQGQIVKISVHCDCSIFAWLFSWVQCKVQNGTARPQITPTLVLPILISSSFLQMDDLVKLCLSYMVEHMVTICLQPSEDLMALPSEMLAQLAKVATISQVERMISISLTTSPATQSRVKQLVNKLYKHKIESTLKVAKLAIGLCLHCRQLFNTTEHNRLSCLGATTVDSAVSNGTQAGRHVPDPEWRLQQHLQDLRAQQVTWRQVFWKLWSVLQVLYCHRCLQYFPACDVGTCSVHTEEPVYQVGRTSGRYPCCGGKAQRNGNVQLYSAGCRPADHQVLPQHILRRLPPGAPITPAALALAAGSSVPPEVLSTCCLLSEHRDLVTPGSSRTHSTTSLLSNTASNHKGSCYSSIMSPRRSSSSPTKRLQLQMSQSARHPSLTASSARSESTIQSSLHHPALTDHQQPLQDHHIQQPQPQHHQSPLAAAVAAALLAGTTATAFHHSTGTSPATGAGLSLTVSGPSGTTVRAVHSSNNPGAQAAGSSSNPGAQAAGSSSNPGTQAAGSSSNPGAQAAGSSSNPGAQAAGSSSNPGAQATGSSSNGISNERRLLSAPAQLLAHANALSEVGPSLRVNTLGANEDAAPSTTSQAAVVSRKEALFATASGLASGEQQQQQQQEQQTTQLIKEIQNCLFLDSRKGLNMSTARNTSAEVQQQQQQQYAPSSSIMELTSTHLASTVWGSDAALMSSSSSTSLLTRQNPGSTALPGARMMQQASSSISSPDEALIAKSDVRLSIQPTQPTQQDCFDDSANNKAMKGVLLSKLRSSLNGRSHFGMDDSSEVDANGRIASGGPAANASNKTSSGSGSRNVSSRKLKMELLHEDDMARIESLVNHLMSCRPPMNKPTTGIEFSSSSHSIARQQSGLPPAPATSARLQQKRSYQAPPAQQVAAVQLRPAASVSSSLHGMPTAASVSSSLHGMPTAASVSSSLHGMPTATLSSTAVVKRSASIGSSVIPSEQRSGGSTEAAERKPQNQGVGFGSLGAPALKGSSNVVSHHIMASATARLISDPPARSNNVPSSAWPHLPH